jgi:hypothetical protein
MVGTGELCYGPPSMAELDEFVKRLGKEPMPTDFVLRGMETIAYALGLLAVEVRRVAPPVQRPSKEKPRKK